MVAMASTGPHADLFVLCSLANHATPTLNFYRLDALTDAQPTVSKQRMQNHTRSRQ